MKDKTRRAAVCLLALTFAFALSTVPRASAQDAKATEKKPAADPANRQVFFGEQHLHTVNSPDAFAMGICGRTRKCSVP